MIKSVANGGLTGKGLNSGALGHQLMVEYYGCAPKSLNDLDHIRCSMIEAAQATGATVVGEVFHEFNPHGISGAVVIAESHLAIHTWPEYGYAAVDFFTCGEEIDPFRGFDLLREKLTAERFEVQEFFRGRIEPLYGKLPHKPSLAEI